MTTPAADLSALRSATSALVRGLADEGLTDADVRAPSLLPGWTRGHVLTHLARNADAIGATLAATLHGQVRALYPGGREERNADIDAGATRPALEQLRDVEQSAERLDEVLAQVADTGAWDRTATAGRTAADWPLARWREVEIHRVDLGGAFTAADWTPEFVRRVLPALVADVDGRLADGQSVRIEVDPDGSTAASLGGTVWTCGHGGEPTAVTGPDWALLAWLLGRPDAARATLTSLPELAPWL